MGKKGQKGGGGGLRFPDIPHAKRALYQAELRPRCQLGSAAPLCIHNRQCRANQTTLCGELQCTAVEKGREYWNAREQSAGALCPGPRARAACAFGRPTSGRRKCLRVALLLPQTPRNALRCASIGERLASDTVLRVRRDATGAGAFRSAPAADVVAL